MMRTQTMMMMMMVMMVMMVMMGRMSVRAAGGLRWAKESSSSTKAHHCQTRLLLLVEVGAVCVGVSRLALLLLCA